MGDFDSVELLARVGDALVGVDRAGLEGKEGVVDFRKVNDAAATIRPLLMTPPSRCYISVIGPLADRFIVHGLHGAPLASELGTDLQVTFRLG